MSYVLVIGIQLCNLAIAFYASHLAVTGDGGRGGIQLVQLVASVWIICASVLAAFLCHARKSNLALKLSFSTLPTLWVTSLLFLAAKGSSLALAAALAILIVGWSSVVIWARRRLSNTEPISLSRVILGSHFSALEWTALVTIAVLAIIVWFQILKAGTI